MTANSNLPSFPLITLEETDSTSRYLTQLCDHQQPEEFTVVTARFQTAGKGQRGNSWESEAGQNLLFSTVFYPTFVEARQQFVLSQLISLSIQEELAQYTDDISIKWPNDIYWREKKICGILIENDLSGTRIGRSIAGIGININQQAFHSDAPNPVSLQQITGQTHDCNALLNGVMARIIRYYRQLQDTGIDTFSPFIANRYACALFRRKGYHLYKDADGAFSARLLRVEADGRFVLEDEAGRERQYLFKEVQYLL